MDTQNGTATRTLALWGLATLGIALALPAQAAPDFVFMESGALVAARSDRDEESRQDRRSKRKNTREASRDEREEDARGYGYGFERREYQRFEDGGRPERRTRN